VEGRGRGREGKAQGGAGEVREKQFSGRSAGGRGQEGRVGEGHKGRTKREKKGQVIHHLPEKSDEVSNKENEEDSETSEKKSITGKKQSTISNFFQPEKSGTKRKREEEAPGPSKKIKQ
jgi:hypothetical protein